MIRLTLNIIEIPQNATTATANKYRLHIVGEGTLEECEAATKWLTKDASDIKEKTLQNH